MKQKKKHKTSRMLSAVAIVEGIVIVAMIILCLFKGDLTIVEEILPEQIANAKPKEYDVILDAGHGGFDGGTMGNGLLEKDITLQMSKKIGAILEQKGYEVAYIREDDAIDWASDEVSDLAYRVDFANKTKAKMMLSLHVNSEDENYGSYGYEIWGRGDDEEALRYANHILSSVDQLGYSQNRGFKDQNTSPLYLTAYANLPTLLMEVGFIGSENDVVYMRSGVAQNKFCESIAQGIMEGLKEMEASEQIKQE